MSNDALIGVDPDVAGAAMQTAATATPLRNDIATAVADREEANSKEVTSAQAIAGPVEEPEGESDTAVPEEDSLEDTATSDTLESENPPVADEPTFVSQSAAAPPPFTGSGL